MPRMDGLELLARLRADARLADSVVFVLTTSNSEEDRQRAHALHVAGYMTKSAVGTRFERLAELLGRYWELNELPE